MNTATATPALTEEFLKAIKSKHLSDVAVYQLKDKTTGERRQYIKLYLELSNPYTTDRQSVYVEQPTTIIFDNYSGLSYSNVERRDVENMVLAFWTNYSRHTCTNHVHHFLKSIKKNSIVSFKVVAYNQNDNLNAVNFVRHDLYGYITEGENVKGFYLANYTGPENSAAPLRTI